MPLVLDVFTVLRINPRIWKAQVNKYTKGCHLDAVHFWHDPSVFQSAWNPILSNNRFIKSDRVSLAVLMLYWSGLSTLWQQLRFKFVFCLLLENRWLIASAVQEHMAIHSWLVFFMHFLQLPLFPSVLIIEQIIPLPLILLCIQVSQLSSFSLFFQENLFKNLFFNAFS